MRTRIALTASLLGVAAIALAADALPSKMPPWAESIGRTGGIALSIEGHTPHLLTTNWGTFFLSSGSGWIAGRIEEGKARLMHRVEGIFGGVRVDTTNVVVIPTDRMPLTTNVLMTVITILQVEAPPDTNRARLQ